MLFGPAVYIKVPEVKICCYTCFETIGAIEAILKYIWLVDKLTCSEVSVLVPHPMWTGWCPGGSCSGWSEKTLWPREYSCQRRSPPRSARRDPPSWHVTTKDLNSSRDVVAAVAALACCGGPVPQPRRRILVLDEVESILPTGWPSSICSCCGSHALLLFVHVSYSLLLITASK